MANELGRTVIHRYMYARSWALGDRKSPLATTPCLIALEGDCDTAIGVYAKIENEKINLKTELFSVDGNERYFVNESGEKESFLNLSKNIGEQLKSKSKGSYKK